MSHWQKIFPCKISEYFCATIQRKAKVYRMHAHMSGNGSWRQCMEQSNRIATGACYDHKCSRNSLSKGQFQWSLYNSNALALTGGDASCQASLLSAELLVKESRQLQSEACGLLSPRDWEEKLVWRTPRCTFLGSKSWSRFSKRWRGFVSCSRWKIIFLFSWHKPSW